MATAGYSTRSLQDKLGIKPGNTVALINAPTHYSDTLGTLPDSIKVKSGLKGGTFDVIQFFARSLADLVGEIEPLKAAMKQTGMLWISWPKKTSGVPTDLNENIVREFVLEQGLVDIKVCAVDEVWSGLKFVVRVKDRKK